MMLMKFFCTHKKQTYLEQVPVPMMQWCLLFVNVLLWWQAYANVFVRVMSQIPQYLNKLFK